MSNLAYRKQCKARKSKLLSIIYELSSRIRSWYFKCFNIERENNVISQVKKRYKEIKKNIYFDLKVILR